MRQLVERIRQTILAAPDTVCLERARLVTEAYRMYAETDTGEPIPMPLLRARALAHILDHMTLDLDTNPVFAGNTSTGPRAWMLLPEYGFTIPGQALIENPGLEGLLDGTAPDAGGIPEELRAFWRERSIGGDAGWGHLIPDYAKLLSQGLKGILAEAERPDGSLDQDALAYRQACAIACRAVIRWAERYAAAAEAAATAIMAGHETDALRAKCLRRVATACRHVPAKPARNLFEALQSIALAHLAIHIEGHGYSVSPGRLDQVLLPYYRDDENATDLLAAFLLKLSANSLWGSHSKTQPITLGGVDAQGRDCCNALTLRILEAFELARMPDPTVFVRWHRHIAPEVKEKATRMLADGFSMPLLVGDEQTVAGLIHAGVTPADAWNYAIIGCNELGVPAKLIWTSVCLPEVGLLRDVLVEDPNLDAINEMDTLLDRIKDRGVALLRRRIEGYQRHLRRSAELVPTPFTSSLMEGCIQRGRDLHAELPYSFLNLRSSGFTNLINALSALDTIVFRTQRATLGDLRQALQTNFREAADLRRQLLEAPKWGNDDDLADRWALAWLKRREAIQQRLEQEPGCPRLLPEMVVRSLHHLDGRDTGATPDGRLAGEPLADSVGAQLGTARGGPTALLNSVCKLQPARYWPGGYNLNLTLPSLVWGNEAMLDRLRSLVDVFFAQGGQELQINCLNADILRDAQVHPERYPDLLVRVAGFNARFVDLFPAQQNELIQRAEACA